MSQAPPATAGPAAASAAKGSAAAPSSEGGAPQDPAAAERSGSTEAAEEAVAAVVERLCAVVAAGEGGQQTEAQNDQDIIEEGGKDLSRTRKRGGRGAGRTTKKAKQQKPADTGFVKYFNRSYVEIPKWVTKHPKDVADIECLAKGKGWDDFTIQEDVVEHGKMTQPHLLFGYCMYSKKVVSACTLETGGTLKLKQETWPRGFLKIGNLLSTGVGNATAKGMLEYVEHVIRESGGELRNSQYGRRGAVPAAWV
jgi:hypothetical protein